jgi:hypothetical protein
MPIAREDLAHMFALARMELNGASDNGLQMELFEVLKELSEDSNAWYEDLTLNPIVGVQDYPLAPTESPSQIIRLWGAWDSNTGEISASMPLIGTLHLRHAPTTLSAVPWYVRVVLTVAFPTLKGDIPVFPSKLFRQYSTTILDGLLGKMMGQIDKSYSNQQQALYHLRRFRTGIQQAKTAAHRQNIMGGQSWMYPRGWGSRSQRGGLSTAAGAR